MIPRTTLEQMLDAARQHRGNAEREIRRIQELLHAANEKYKRHDEELRALEKLQHLYHPEIDLPL